VIPLITKGVSFGTIRYRGGRLDTSQVEGVDPDLVVRPFGRKGEFATVRGFDLGAMQFHFGMQPVEIFGEGVDDDEDGVANEIRIGEISALEIFNTTLERPRRDPTTKEIRHGEQVFLEVGCADCHVPMLTTRSRFLRYRHPEDPTDPELNVYYQVDLSKAPAHFKRAKENGLAVPLFADLKRHDMGPGLAESFGSALDAQFTTARLWGVGDTAPYLHDGRATTLAEAILEHGGEGQEARDAFAELGVERQAQLLAFLRSLRTPENPSADLDR
jgi:cytochrome c peroxidase